MFLEKLEIQGFKSFANRNVLVFPGMLDKNKRGITAIVGPNGSGKSNVADAIRWALGEQSMKTLRGKKAEDIIFSGSDKKGRLGMAEVSLYLNNEDGQAPIDYSQIVITRRLYRNGDSEYLLNNNRVRLSDIQMLLAKANFGQKTYSVIGQGMVEGFLNTSLAERKEFFDEATGVKQYQIKRDESLNKLRATYENLSQAQMLLIEIEPRLKSLTRQVNRLRKRGEIEAELKELQKNYYACLWQEINNQFSRYNRQFLELEKEKLNLEKKVAALNRELAQIEADSEETDEAAGWQVRLTEAQKRKEEISRQLAKLETQMEMKLEAGGQIDLSFLLTKKEKLEEEIKNIKEEIISQEKNIAIARERSEELRQAEKEVNKEISFLNDRLSEINKQAKGETEKEISQRLKKALYRLKKVLAEEETSRLREKVREVAVEIEEILQASVGKDKEERLSRWQEIEEKLKKLSQKKEAIMVKINENNLRISVRSERIKLLKEKVKELEAEINFIGEKLKRKTKKEAVAEFNRKHNILKEERRQVEEELAKIQDKIVQFNRVSEERRKKIFSLQREMQARQNELYELNRRMGEVKISSTRFETKLEDLEIEAREELGNLKKVKETAAILAAKSDLSAGREEDKIKISQLKRQLELIGGIDSQIEKEYEETKERYDFLSGQVEDLTKTISSLEQIIKELDVTIKKRFDRAFRVIEENFEKYFKILFGGGTAKIIKVMDLPVEEEKNKSEQIDKDDREAMNLKKIKFLQKHNATGLAGIEIKATPPSKKITSITMLSGGERALTAIALICAIISFNPAPFVVLDEVDAALDEANSERLARILDELSHKTQFIVITHNRASMRKAAVLYGITMGDDGVSHLLSIKLEEAVKHK
jgi:chromosome segregation protein